jgi:uncharacterized membrane protein (UPF0127 family)
MSEKLITITNETNNQVVAHQIRLATSFFQRFRGLMLAPSLSDGQGILISPCNSVHMMFMRFPIDAVFLSKNNEVTHLYPNLRPWLGITKLHRDTKSVLELKQGTIQEKNINIGDKLSYTTKESNP